MAHLTHERRHVRVASWKRSGAAQRDAESARRRESASPLGSANHRAAPRATPTPHSPHRRPVPPFRYFRGEKFLVATWTSSGSGSLAASVVEFAESVAPFYGSRERWKSLMNRPSLFSFDLLFHHDLPT